MTTETTTKGFADAGFALGKDLLDQVERENPVLYAKVAQAIAVGERLNIALEFGKGVAAIRMFTVDDYQVTKQVVSIAGFFPFDDACKEQRKN
jgi:hypothetical protein